MLYCANAPTHMGARYYSTFKVQGSYLQCPETLAPTDRCKKGEDSDRGGLIDVDRGIFR